MMKFDMFSVGGEWVTPHDGARIDVLDSITEDVIGSVPEGARADVDRAVAAAREAFPYWADSAPTDRGLLLSQVAQQLKDRRDELADVLSHEMGMPPARSAAVLVGLSLAAQRDRVRGYIEKGIEEGAKLLIGGADAPKGLDQGYFVKPTVFSNVIPRMTIAQEEIFGPVLSIMAYDSEDEAIRIANDTIYGLAGAVWGSEARARRVAGKIRAGSVRINAGAIFRAAPFGGYKQSGVGREFGRMGFEEFLEVKAVFV